MAEAHAPHGYKQYMMIWVWLLVMTVLALGVGYTSIPHAVKALLLVGITLAKIGLIGAFFMHLKFERMNLVMLTFSPIVLSIILFCFTYGETGQNDKTHQIMVRGNHVHVEAPEHH
jgi:cytochrome c oxidase subunit 4